jgi:hypothetical protein
MVKSPSPMSILVFAGISDRSINLTSFLEGKLLPVFPTG